MDYVRFALIILIVLEHASLAYMPNAQLDYLGPDSAVWFVADPSPSGNIFFFLQSFRLSFAIPLLFFISGLFVEGSLQRHTTLQYLKHRLFRIGIPLCIIAFVFAPFMSYFRYLEITQHSFSVYFFLTDFFSYGHWYIAHGWFLWALLLFEGVVVLWRRCWSRCYHAVAHFMQKLVEHQCIFMIVLFGLTYIVYIASTYLLIDSMRVVWYVLSGPFAFFIENILVCFLFFILGVLLGEAYGTARLASPWLWVILSAIFFVMQCMITIVPGHSILTLGHPTYQHINILTTPALCVLLSLAVLSGFRRYCGAFSRVGQFFADSSYLIYIVHLPVCVLAQYLLLPLDISVYIKWLMTAGTGIFVSVLCYIGLVWVRKNVTKEK